MFNLGQQLKDFANKAANAVLDIADAKGSIEKRKKYLLLLLLLRDFGQEITAPLWAWLLSSVNRSTSRLLDQLPDSVQGQATLDKDAQASIAQSEVENTKKKLLLLFAMMSGLASRVSGGRDEDLR